MTEDSDKTPVIGPFLRLLQSRKFLVALMTLVVDVIIVYLPELEAAQGEMIAVFTLVGSVLIASIAYEDGKLKQREP